MAWQPCQSNTNTALPAGTNPDPCSALASKHLLLHSAQRGLNVGGGLLLHGPPFQAESEDARHCRRPPPLLQGLAHAAQRAAAACTGGGSEEQLALVRAQAQPFPDCRARKRLQRAGMSCHSL